MKANWIRKSLSGLSFASALFIFQACYGTPQDMGLDVYIEGQVKSKATGGAIEGIRVTVANTQYIYTDAEGKFSLYTGLADEYKVRFQDIDSTENGRFHDKDTILANIEEQTYLSIQLEEK